MSEDKNKSLILRPGGELTGKEKRSSTVIGRMTEDVLAEADARKIRQVRYRIGEYELREPDFRQVCDWAKTMSMAPEELINHLAGNEYMLLDGFVKLEIEEGAIVSLVWDFWRIRHIPEITRDGLLIRVLAFTGERIAPAGCWPDTANAYRPRLSELTTLYCDNLGITKLDLAFVPKLTTLHCGINKLTELDLSPVHELTTLYCDNNNLTELNLSPVPRLKDLSCDWNELTELDLYQVPKLNRLICDWNGLTELDLSPVPELNVLACDSKIKLLNAPKRFLDYAQH